MKKGFLVILVVAVAAFFIHGCQSTSRGPDTSGKTGYPAGHDLHPGTDQDQKEEAHPLQGYS